MGEKKKNAYRFLVGIPGQEFLGETALPLLFDHIGPVKYLIRYRPSV
jgi:hypothetical protein